MIMLIGINFQVISITKNNNNLLDCHQIIHPAQKHELKSLKCTQKQEDSKWINTDRCYKPMTVRVEQLGHT